MPRLTVTRSSTIAIVGVTGVLLMTPLAGAAGASSGSHPSVGTIAKQAVTPKLGPGGRVIVMLRNHATTVAARTTAQREQAAVAQNTEHSVASQIRSAGGSVSHSYTLINAVAASVTAKEAKALAANPNVAKVVPDEPIKESPATPNPTAASGAQPPTSPPANTCKPNGKVQLEPEALEATRADSDVPGAKTARSLGYTGKGVTVGWIADGLDIHNPDFMRNGHTIFSDYQDFSGQGPNAPTGGDEAFLDASAIAAQGKHVYDVSHFSDRPLNRPCNIRIEGEAPGVNLVGLNIFGSEDAGFNSSFIQAIQYAVTHDHVNVLNESLGNEFYPDDNGSLDAVKAANDAAVAAGTTITVSSGDAGVTNTIITPSTDPNVISVGGSTTYRFYLQTGYGGARLPGITGWLNNNISGLSSGGFNQAGKTVTLVAPGDLNYALCSKNLAKFSECADFAGNAIGVEESGGTSESAPVTAGVAALVIQAYRNGHHGASPTPAQIKTILTSTADDISAPAEQQGAGLVDAYKAVQLAKSFGNGSSGRTGHSITSSASNFSAIGATSTTEHFTDTITNSGTTAQTIHASTRALGAYTRVRTTTVTLSDAHSQKYVDFQGITDNVEKVTFHVPANENRLNASIAFQNASFSDLAARVRMDLVDPSGRLALYDVPQGLPDYGNGQVSNPEPGTWTAYITSRDSADGGSEGPVHFAASVARFGIFGNVSPATLHLAPGGSGTVAVTAKTKAVPGDKAGSLVLTSSAHAAGVPATTTVPVTLRSLIPAGNHSFTDILTGGNGRQGNVGQEEFYNLDVPAGAPELNASVTLANDPNDEFYDELVSPSGNALAFGSNTNVVTVNGELEEAGHLGSQLHVLNPAAGRWTVIVIFAPAVSGNEIKEPFTVATNQNAIPASAAGLPDSSSTAIKAGTTKTVNVKIKNTGNSPEAFFVDPRLSTSSVQQLAALGDSTTTEPLTIFQNIPEYLVPTHTTALAGAATTTGPADIQADMSAPNGDPDIESGIGKTVTLSYSDPTISQGPWALVPTEVGPFSKAGPKETVDTGAAVKTRDFDPSITSATGDLWLASVDPTASLDTVSVAPGQTATIPIKIKASGAPRTVAGTLYVDDANLLDFDFFPVPNGNEVAALPYTYTVTK